MKFDFSGKHVVITGGASGIGFAQVQKFLEAGATVSMIDCQNLDCEQKEQLLFIERLDCYQIDIRNTNLLKKTVDEILSKFNRVDILLNTAGILDNYQATLMTSEELWDDVFNTNVKAMFLLTNAILPFMLAVKSGIIINMASIAGLQAGGGGASYTAAKHAIIGYTKQLTYDYAKCGIRANCIAPGAIDTPMNQNDFIENDGAMAAWVAQETPAKRWASAAEVADLTLFLASSQADYIHGSVQVIDGGWTIK